MSHADIVERIPNGFETIASTENCQYAIIQNLKKQIFGVQFHPEVVHTKGGKKIELHPTPLVTRIRKHQPLLVPATIYSRSCQRTRVPVLLTDEEKKKMDEEHPGSYDNILEYSVNPNKKYHYVCPKFWNLKEKRVVTQEEIDENPELKKHIFSEELREGSVDLGEKYIMDLSKRSFYTPGVMSKKKHPNGFFMPCCFLKKTKKIKT